MKTTFTFLFCLSFALLYSQKTTKNNNYIKGTYSKTNTNYLVLKDTIVSYQAPIAKTSINKDTLYLLKTDVGLFIAEIWAHDTLVKKKPVIVWTSSIPNNKLAVIRK